MWEFSLGKQTSKSKILESGTRSYAMQSSNTNLKLGYLPGWISRPKQSQASNSSDQEKSWVGIPSSADEPCALRIFSGTIGHIRLFLFTFIIIVMFENILTFVNLSSSRIHIVSSQGWSFQNVLQIKNAKLKRSKDPNETPQQQHLRRCRAHRLANRPHLLPLDFWDINSRLQCSDSVGCFPSLYCECFEGALAMPHVSSQTSNSLPSAESPIDWPCGRLA